MKPGDPYFALYTRAVLPDEIDEDPVETQGNRRALSRARPWKPCSDNVGIRAKDPAPDEGLVDRMAKVIAGYYDSTDAGLCARAVLAEIAKEAGNGDSAAMGWMCRAITDEKRVAELETELKRAYCSVSALEGDNRRLTSELATARVRISNQDALLVNCRANREKLTADIATVTCERDELASRHGVDCVNAQRLIDSLTRELAEAEREAAHWRSETDAFKKRDDRHIAELAEAREELRAALLSVEMRCGARVLA